jgi:hypothetical protein
MAKNHQAPPLKPRKKPAPQKGRLGIIAQELWLCRDDPNRVLDTGGRPRADAPTSAVNAAVKELRKLRGPGR